jgi:hypothetical protein
MNRRSVLRLLGIAPVAVAGASVVPVGAAEDDATLARSLRGMAKTFDWQGYENCALTLRRAAYRLNQVDPDGSFKASLTRASADVPAR